MSYLPSDTSFVSDGNSSTTPLSGSATFTGTGELVSAPQVGFMVKTDQPGTVYFDFSNDGTNWDSTFPVNGFNVAANISEFHTAVKLGRYFRIRFVNNSTSAQTFFRLTTYFGTGFLPSIAPLNQTAGLDQDAIFTRNSIAQDEIRIGRRSGVTGWTKFAYRDNLQAANGEEVIWATSAGNTFSPSTSAGAFRIAYDQTVDGAGTSGATDLAVYYINASGNPAVGTHALTSSGSDTTSFTGYEINRIAVTSTGGNKINAAEILFIHSSASATKAVIPASSGVTQGGIYANGHNHDAVAKFLYFNVNKVGGSSPIVTIKGYAYNLGTDCEYEVFRHTIDSAVENTVTINEPVGFNLSPQDVLYFVADTNTNDTVVTIRFSLNEYQRT